MDYPVEELIHDMPFKDNEFQTLKNGLMLTNWEIDVLKRYNIPFYDCHTLKELMYEIEKVLSSVEDLEDLEQASVSISERDYYQNTSF